MRRFLLLLFPLLLIGCATTKNMTITTRPPDASIKVDGNDVGKGQVTTPIVFKDKDDTHTVVVSRLGFKDQSIPLKRDFEGEQLNVDLKPLTKRVTITSSPPARIAIDGKP